MFLFELQQINEPGAQFIVSAYNSIYTTALKRTLASGLTLVSVKTIRNGIIYMSILRGKTVHGCM